MRLFTQRVTEKLASLPPLIVICAIATFLSPSGHAQDNVLKDLSERCHNEMQRVNGAENKKCPTNIKDPNYRTCIAKASATSTKAYETCMGGTPQGACAGREFSNTSRSGVEGLLARYCALRQCGYSSEQVAALDLTKGRMVGGSGAGAIAVPNGFKWSCPGDAQPQQNAQATSSTTAAANMGSCKSSPSFKSAGWKCSDLKGQVSQFDKYNIPANERFCTSSQIDTLVAANDVATCSNIVEQGEAVIKKYRDADAAVDMGNCKASPKFGNTGWNCAALAGHLTVFNELGVPASERICTEAQIRTLIARKNDGICSNVVSQGEAILKPYRDRAAAAKAAAELAALQPKIDMGKCKPAAGIDSKGWDCRQVMGMFDDYAKYNVPVAEQLCTKEQATALVTARSDANCGNVVVQTNNLIDKYKKNAAAAAAAAAEAAKPKVDMGNCKASPKFANRGWDCNALKGQESQFEPLGIPAAERICTPAQIEALAATKDAAVCSNVVEQREAVLNAYRNKAKAAREAFMGKCKPAAGFENTGFACSAVNAFLAEAVKYQVPEENRICSPEQAKELIAANNDGHCSNVARQIAAATKRHRESPAAAPKPAAQGATTTTATTTAPQAQSNKPPVQSTASATPIDMGNCKPVAGVVVGGWNCSHLTYPFENEYKTLNIPASEQLCSRAQADALVAAKNTANCGNVVAQLDAIFTKYRAKAKSANTMTINSASYGKNCPNAKNADVTSKVKGSCDGKEKCAYTVSAGVLGDTASGCAKAFEVEYTCPAKGTRKLNLAAEANNKIADLDCNK